MEDEIIKRKKAPHDDAIKEIKKNVLQTIIESTIVEDCRASFGQNKKCGTGFY